MTLTGEGDATLANRVLDVYAEIHLKGAGGIILLQSLHSCFLQSGITY